MSLLEDAFNDPNSELICAVISEKHGFTYTMRQWECDASDKIGVMRESGNFAGTVELCERLLRKNKLSVGGKGRFCWECCYAYHRMRNASKANEYFRLAKELLPGTFETTEELFATLYTKKRRTGKKKEGDDNKDDSGRRTSRNAFAERISKSTRSFLRWVRTE